MSQFDAVPEELKERDQWLLWDSDSDTPRRPHWRGDFYGISWSDPDDWHSFEEAVEVASEKDSWGIGYVFAESNSNTDEGEYGFLDLDNCLREEREEKPKDWLPTLSEFMDGYIEYSAGGYGLHIPFKGDIPDWWSNPDEDEHEGPEAWDNKFCAITGDAIPSCTPENGVVCEDVSPFLLKAYELWHGEYPDFPEPDDGDRDGGGSGDYDGEEFLTDEDIEEALEYIDPDISMREWWNIGRAIQDYDSTANGKRIYTQWSKGGSSWDDQAPKLIDWLWKESDPGSGTTLGTLIYRARENGWDMPTPSAAGTDGSEVVETDEDEEKELPTPDTFSVKDGGYGYWVHRDDDPDEWREVTNFQIETNSFATDPDDPTQKKIDMTIHPAVGEPYDVVKSPTVFNEKRDFKRHVVTGLTTTFSGGQDELNKLKRFVGTQDAPFRIGKYQMGRFGEEFVTPNGVLTADGWTDDPEHIHVAREIGAERKWELSPEDGDEYNQEEVADILELLPQTRDSERFLPVLGWYYSTPFKPLIQEWTGQFNLLGILGESGAGKSATLQVLWQLFGMADEPMTADDTKYVLLTTLASSNSIPMWFDEYKPSNMSDWAVDTFWNEVRKTTRGGVSARGNADGTTDEFHLTAPVVVSGEERVHGSAEERRGIYTTFKEATAETGSDTSRAFAKLTGLSQKDGEEIEYFDGYDFKQHALAYYQWVLKQDDEEVRQVWRTSAKHVAELLAEHNIEGIADLVEQGLQTVKFGATMFRAFADAMGADPDIVSTEAVDEAILYAAQDSIGGANRKSHLDSLVEVAARAASHGYLEEGEHYKFVHEGRADEEIRVNLTTGFDMIAKYANDHDVAEDLLNSKDDYEERIKEGVETDDSYIARYSQPTKPIGRATGIYVNDAVEQLDGFEKSMFTHDEEDMADDVVPVPLSNPGVGYQTVTVEVVSRATDAPNPISETGVLRDSTGTVDYVVWDRADPIDIEEGKCYKIEDAKVGTDPDGATQLELNGRVASATEIQSGVGYLGMKDSSDNEQLSAATDGGNGDEFAQPQPKMKQVLNEEGPLPQGEWVEKATSQYDDLDVDGARHGIEELKKKGEVTETADGWGVV